MCSVIVWFNSSDPGYVFKLSKLNLITPSTNAISVISEFLPVKESEDKDEIVHA